MKTSRIVSGGLALAFAAGSALFFSGAAAAADSYVIADDFGDEGSSYPADWFLGTVSAPGTATSTVSGLNVLGPVQLLNGTPGTSPEPDLVALVEGTNLGIVSGDVNFQIPLFADPDNSAGFTTLRPDNFGNMGLNPLAGWTTSRDVGTLSAGTSHTLVDYQDELESLTTQFEILAYGIIVPAGSSAVVSSITWNDDTTWFTPVPTGVATPASLSQTAASTTGVTATLTGFVPGETVDGFFASQSMGSDTGATATADATGTVTFKYVLPSGVLPSEYRLGGTAAVSGVASFAVFTVVADAAPVPAPAAPPATAVPGTATFTG